MRNPIKIITRDYSPLKIRPSIRRIKKTPYPWKTFVLVFWPFPWKYSLPQALLSVEFIQSHSDIVAQRQAGIRQLYDIPIYRLRDTPLRSLYRLFEYICASDFVMMGYECTYFFFHSESSWSLSCVPDPKDEDPIRYAMIASMVEGLVDAFNWRINLGIYRSQLTTEPPRETSPSWTAKVPASEKCLIFNEYGCKDDDMTPERHFLKRNIRIPNGYLYTL